MKPRHPLIALPLAGILWAVSLAAPGAVVHGQPLTMAEAAVLPPVCKLILIEKPEVNISAYNQRKYADLFERPEYRMAKNAPFLHHWCWALVAKQRYFGATSELKRRGYKSSFHNEMNWVIRHMAPGWPYGPMMHAEHGEMYLLEKNYGDAVSAAYGAIRLDPAFPRAYVLLVNVYNAMGQKDKALEAATEGLKRNPESGALRKLYDALGGPKPYPEPYAKPASQTAEQDPGAPPLPPPASDDFKASDAEEAVTQPLRAPGEPDPGSQAADSAAPRPNKYCRFCP